MPEINDASDAKAANAVIDALVLGHHDRHFRCPPAGRIGSPRAVRAVERKRELLRREVEGEGGDSGAGGAQDERP